MHPEIWLIEMHYHDSSVILACTHGRTLTSRQVDDISWIAEEVEIDERGVQRVWRGEGDGAPTARTGEEGCQAEALTTQHGAEVIKVQLSGGTPPP